MPEQNIFDLYAQFRPAEYSAEDQEIIAEAAREDAAMKAHPPDWDS